MISSARATALCLAMTILPAVAAGQQTDAQWLEDCADRRDRGNLVRFCDVRVSQMAAPGGTLRVDPGANGGIAIEGWSGRGIEIHARIEARAETEASARGLADGVRVTTGAAGIGATGPDSDRYSNWHVSFVVYVPETSDLELSTLNGPLSVRGVTGRMQLEAVNGPVSLRDVGGNVYARAQNGPLSITLSGSGWQGEGLDAETLNGPVTLTVPDNYNAELLAGTDNGPFSSDIPLTVTLRGRMRGPINATLGRGGAPIRVVTTNGPIQIRRTAQGL
jgi:hypothetical protein